MKKSILSFCVALSFSGAALAQDEEPIRTYCCNDDSGAQLCASHRLLEKCRGRAYRIIDQNGNVLKRVAAREKQEEEARSEAERKKAEKKERLDQALLDTYYSEEEITLVQKRQERKLNREIKKIEERLAAAQAKKAKLEKQKKQYKTESEVPQSVKVQLETANNEEFAELSLLDSKTQELEELGAKFDADRKRFKELSEKMRAAAEAEEAKRRTRKGEDY